MKIKLLSLFSGIGAFEKALENLGIEYDLVGFSEIDKYAVKSYCAIHNISESLSLGDITKMDISKLPKDIDMITHGSPCFAAGTKVITDKGYKNIEDIQIGDKVLTHTNSFKTVEALGSDGIKDIYKVETQGTLPIYCTNNHPFYVRHKVKQWNTDKRTYEYKFTEPEKVRLINLTKNNNYIGIPIIPDKENELYNLDDETLWLLGRYVADGCYYNKPREDRPSNIKYTSIYVGNNKKLDFENHIKSYKYNNVDERNGCTSYRFGVDFTNIVIKYNVGSGAINKKIPMEILQLSKQKLHIFLDGYMSGDGCNIKNTTIYQATTISRELAESLLLAIQKVYNIGCRIYYTKRPKKYIIENRVVNQNDTYMVRFDLKPKRPLYKVENNCIWYPIKKITNTYTQQTIYNITVEDDHTYTANNCYVGNCQDFSTAGRQAGGDFGTGTRSSLMWNTVNIVTYTKPKYIIWENVKNLVSKKHKHNFDKYILTLRELGYNSYYKILNAKDYGLPQNRERVYVISIRKDIDKGNFKFPEKEELRLRLKDILEKDVSQKYFLNDKQVKNFLLHGNCNPSGRGMGGEVCVDDISPTLTVNKGDGLKIAVEDSSLDVHQNINKLQESLKRAFIYKRNMSVNVIGNYTPSNHDASRVVDSNGIAPTVKENHGTVTAVNVGFKLRKLTPRECWRLMGFSDTDFDKVSNISISENQLRKQAGNSICVSVLERIFKQLFKEELEDE